MESLDQFHHEYRKVMQHRIAFWKKKFGVEEVQIIHPSNQNEMIDEPDQRKPLTKPVRSKSPRPRIFQELHALFMFF